MTDEEDTAKLSTAPEPGEPTPGRRSRAFSRALLLRLPKLSVASWGATDTLNVVQDMQGVVDLDADAFLQPLESLGEKRNERS